MVQVVFVREDAYHTVVPEYPSRLAIYRMPALHPYIRSAANAKSPQRSDRGQKSLVGGCLCEAPLARKKGTSAVLGLHLRPAAVGNFPFPHSHHAMTVAPFHDSLLYGTRGREAFTDS